MPVISLNKAEPDRETPSGLGLSAALNALGIARGEPVTTVSGLSGCEGALSNARAGG